MTDANGHVDSLALIDSARVALEQARTLPDIGAIRDVAERARRYASAAKLGVEAVNHATRLRVDAERKAGKLIAETPKQKPGQYQQRSDSPTVAIPPKISDLGISKQQSSDWQTMARMPDTAYQRLLDKKVAQDDPISTKAVVKEARKLEQQQVTAVLNEAEDDKSGRSAHINLLAQYSRGMSPIVSVCLIHADAVARALIHDGRVDSHRGYARMIRSWLDAVEAEMTLLEGQPLQIVGGRRD